MSEEFYLAPDVYVCVTEGHCVFLDLKRDKYSAVMLTPEQRVEFASATPEKANAILSECLAAQSEELIQADVLTIDASVGRTIRSSAVAGVDGHILGLDDQRIFGALDAAADGLKITLGEMVDFFVASASAARDLKRKHISGIVADVRRRRERAKVPADIAEVRRLTKVFRRLRPWYPRAYLCLYDSLALVHFMARRKAFPVWVFGVNAQPFNAHCWVQSERLLLNEGTEYAAQFTPIMAV